MKATNNSILEMSVRAQEKLSVPDEFKTEPERFERYIWITQDDEIVPINDFEDNHLFHTYKMLVNTVLYAKDMAKHTMLTAQMQAVVIQSSHHLRYIAHEYYLRHYIGNKELDNKYKIVEHIAVKMEDVE